MRFLKNISRIVFGAPPKCLLSELFESEPQATAGIVLEETGLPYGGVTTYRWWTTNRAGFFLKSHREFGVRQVGHESRNAVQDAAGRFDELCLLLERETMHLKNHIGNIRDGVVYRLCWGTKDQKRTLTVQNPPPDSWHSRVIQKLRENAWE